MTNGNDQQTCCIIGGCCGGEKDVNELAEWFERHAGLNHGEAHAAARAMHGPHGFDLAPKGTVKPLIQWVATQVRLHPNYNEET